MLGTEAEEEPPHLPTGPKGIARGWSCLASPEASPLQWTEAGCEGGRVRQQQTQDGGAREMHVHSSVRFPEIRGL